MSGPFGGRSAVPMGMGMGARAGGVRTGCSGTITVRNMPWLETEVTSKPRTKKANARNSIVVPALATAASLTNDPYWQDILNNGARGKFPRGFYLDVTTSTLTHRKKSRSATVAIPSDPREALEVIISFLREQAGIRSQRDFDRDKATMDRSTNKVNLPALAKKRKARGLLVSAFVRMLGEKYGLSDRQRKELRTTINIGFLQGYFNSTSFVFEGNRIVALKGISYDESAHSFYIDETACQPKSARQRTYISASEYISPSNRLTENLPAVDFISVWKKRGRGQTSSETSTEEIDATERSTTD